MAPWERREERQRWRQQQQQDREEERAKLEDQERQIKQERLKEAAEGRAPLSLKQKRLQEAAAAADSEATSATTAAPRRLHGTVGLNPRQLNPNLPPRRQPW
eukprot:NODE_2793_length_874_cov_1.776557.p2 GENE.NODE_2793_length_874_cov_1.776557~~NODE_2793_length_874_cov_1.776557.p2  ORF type:complete len:102 (+),score=7.19 NODE_2793_length_874_cov_1.776557:521-826(+)